MANIKAPTTANNRTLMSGHCYIRTTKMSITVATLVREKVQAELRKARAAHNVRASSIEELMNGPLDTTNEDMVVATVMGRIADGAVLVVVDGQAVQVTDTVKLRKDTSLRFDIPALATA